jgi:hypothetical protein
MAKRTSGTRIADGISSYIDKAVGKLTSRRDALRKELDQVERELAGVRASVMAGLKGSGKPRRGIVRAARQLSTATRKKMAEAARRRWAAAKKAGLNKLG